MMWLQHWVRTIIVLVIFAGFLELLLPSGNMKPTVQVLVGLFVLTLLLNPIIAIVGHISQDPQVRLPVISETGAAAVLAQGNDLKELQLQYAAAQYRASIERQVKALLQMKNGKAEVEVDVDISTDPNGTDFGQFNSLKLCLWSADKDEMLPDAEALAGWLADFYGLARDKVIVRVRQE